MYCVLQERKEGVTDGEAFKALAFRENAEKEREKERNKERKGRDLKGAAIVHQKKNIK